MMPPPSTPEEERDPTRRRHVGLTVPRAVKEHALEAAGVMRWPLGTWVLAAAAEHGPRLREALGEVRVAKRPKVAEATFTALYVTDDERAELDDQARACGLNRSAFVTAVARLALGAEVDEVCADLRGSSKTPS
jgi:hypothetical protein